MGFACGPYVANARSRDSTRSELAMNESGKPLKSIGSIASSPEARRRMVTNHSRDTKPELRLRTALHRRGLRYFVHRATIQGLRRQADIVFPRIRLAVYLDGCFWHGCPIHASWPKANATFWREKIERNRRRDADTDCRLVEAGWESIRIWEHDDVEQAADLIVARVASRRASLTR